MKELYLLVLQRLQGLPLLKHIDKDYGQFETWYGDRPRVEFPCALIRTDSVQCRNITRGTQQCTAVFSIRLCFNTELRTAGLFSEARREKALEYYNTVQRITELFQGFTNGSYSAFERLSQTEGLTPAGLVVTLSFRTSYAEST